MKSYVKFLILLLITVNNINESFGSSSSPSSSSISRKKIMIDSSLWALNWFEKNKNELISMTDQQLKFRLYQVLVNYSKMSQKKFDDIFGSVLKIRDISILEKASQRLSKKIFLDKLRF